MTYIYIYVYCIYVCVCEGHRRKQALWLGYDAFCLHLSRFMHFTCPSTAD